VSVLLNVLFSQEIRHVHIWITGEHFPVLKEVAKFVHRTTDFSAQGVEPDAVRTAVKYDTVMILRYFL